MTDPEEASAADKPADRSEPPVLPSSTTDDTDAGWGETPADQDEWLRAQRPPHWE